MNTISFMSANYVARELGYHMTEGWMQGDEATQAAFRPLATFGERFDALLAEVRGLGFRAIDLWLAHLHPDWATPEHIAIARERLAAHGLTVVSLAGGFGATREEFERSCQLAAALGATVLGGGTALVAEDRAAAAAILRAHGLKLGIENHPEKTPAELLARMGAGDEDVIGAAVDTGWFGTQGYDAAVALDALAGRLFHIHLKDVRAPGAHETCRFGAGVVPVHACVASLLRQGYTGPISIEHEPETFNPNDDVAASRTLLERWLTEAPGAAPLGVAIVGCGNIAGPYVQDIRTYPALVLRGVTDLDHAKAAAFAAQHHTHQYATLDELLADPAVDIVINLTIHHAHYDVTTRLLQAGKHVYSEKPLALSGADAAALVRLAAEQGVRLASAPITLLGVAQQSAWRRIRDGELGAVRVVFAEVNWGRIESWHPNPVPFYDVGPMQDVGVYPLTLLAALFGPVRTVSATAATVAPQRVTKDGVPFMLTTPDLVIAVLTHESGTVTRLTADFYVSNETTHQTGLELHGDKGSLFLQSWFQFSSPLQAAAFGEPFAPAELDSDAPDYIRWGRGLNDLALAIRAGRPHRFTGELAAHVCEVLEAVRHSYTDGRPVAVASSFPPVEPVA